MNGIQGFPEHLKLIDENTGDTIEVESADLTPRFDSETSTINLYGDVSGHGTVAFEIGVDQPTPEGDFLYASTISNGSVDTASLTLSEESLGEITLPSTERIDYDDSYEDEDYF